MKKITFIALAALAASLGFSSCQKNEIASEQGLQAEGDFKIYADITKTTIDGLSTKWAAGDAINVFHAEADSTEYGSNSKFTISEDGLTKGQFTGTLSGELAASNDWYALYPYSSYISTPANTDGFINIGSSSSAKPEVQTGNNSTAHLAGQYFPLYAKAEKIAGTAAVALTFKPALSIVKFHVKNGTADPITVSSISMTAQESLIGSFIINFAGDTPTFTDKYVANTASLTVNGGEEIAAGDSADFYLAIKPFTNTEGSTLTFKVNSQERTSTGAATFACGTVNTVNFTYDKQEKDFSVENVAVLAKNGDKYYAMSGEPGTASFMPEAEVTYDGTATTVTVTGDQFVWTIAKTPYGYTFQNKSNSKYLSYTGTSNYAYVVETLAEECYMTIQEDGEYVNVINKKVSTRVLRNNHNATRFAFYTGTTGSNTLLFVKASVDSSPILNPITSPDKVAAAGATGLSVSYTVTNPVAGRVASASATVDWIKNLDCTTFGTITFDVDANTGDERNATVTVTYDGAAASQTFTVTQEANGGYTLQFTKNNNNAYANYYDVTINGITWNAPGNQSLDADTIYGGKIKIGGKLAEATDRWLYSKSPIGGALNTITFRHGASDSEITVNSLKISSYSTADNAAAGTNALDTKDVTFTANAETSISVSGENWSGKYIRIVYNLSSSNVGKNKGVELFYVKFKF